MLKWVSNGLEHTFTLLTAWPSPVKRQMVQRMIAFSRMLPRQFEQPLPQMMRQLTPAKPLPPSLSETQVRQLADAVAAWHLKSPLGICLRRSLLRYHFLREGDIPVTVIFGARLKDAAEGGGLGGHAWLTLHDEPYFENPTDYEGFSPMYRYPPNRNSGD